MKKRRKYKSSFIFIISVFFVLIQGFIQAGCGKKDSTPLASFERDDLELIAQAYRNGQSDLFVTSSGIVDRLLSDDLKGSRHQRFIIRLANGQTLLVSHNIDLASRIEQIQIGDRIFFRGEYEWNDKGGVIHWTHHDPSGRQSGGWIEHRGKRYR